MRVRGSGGSSSSASSSLVVETSFVLKTLDPGRMFEPTGLMIDHTIYDTLLTIYALAKREKIPTYQAADRLAEERLRGVAR